MNDMTLTNDTRRSLRGRLWGSVRVAPVAVSRDYETKAEHPIVARILAGRGVRYEDLDHFFNPKLRDTCPNPSRFKDMDKGIARCVEALEKGECIWIWSDYDVDGNASAALMAEFLQMCGANLGGIRMPDRIKEGYGPNTTGMLALKEEKGADLVFVLDAGIVAYEPLAACKAAGLDVIVIDHHSGRDQLPEACAVINANRKDESGGYEYLCAGGMSLVFCIGLARALKDSGYCTGENGRPSVRPDPIEVLDLAALATFCDMVPLEGFNRALAVAGERLMSRRSRVGLAALAEVSKIKADADITGQHCGWQLGPRINSGGRIGEPDMGALLLIEKDPAKATAMARHLDDLNQERKGMSEAAAAAAVAQIGERSADDRTLAIAVLEDTHEGVLGLAASKVMETFRAPTVVLGTIHETDEDGAALLKGSARSLDGFHLATAFGRAKERGLTVKEGGHGKAAGVTLRADKLKEFTDFMNAEIAASEFARIGPSTHLDLDIDASEFTTALCLAVERMQPFGIGNEEPLVLIRNIEVMGMRTMSEGKHVAFDVSSKTEKREAVYFGVKGTDLEVLLDPSTKGRKLDLLGTLTLNRFRNSVTPQFMIRDARWAEGELI